MRLEMKRAHIWLVLLLATAILFANCHQASQTETIVGPRILLVNPGQGEIEDLIKMVKRGVVHLDHPQLIAVYGAQVERDVSRIKHRIEEQQVPFVRFEVVAGRLEPANLFMQNPCSDDFRRLFRNSDAALFYGGADIPPTAYGQKTDLLTVISTPHRHYFELSFLFHLLGGRQNPDVKPLLEEKPDYVIRAFCLGMQTMNVATGGTMIQDIPSEIYHLRYVEDYLALADSLRHDNYWSKLDPHANVFWCHFQPIRFVNEGFFITQMKLTPTEKPLVCSSHHQAVKELGQSMQIAATSLDGQVVEALVHARYRHVLGVQFHPEPFAIYQKEGSAAKLTPQDTTLLTIHEYLQQKASLEFHQKFWLYFSSLLKN